VTTANQSHRPLAKSPQGAKSSQGVESSEKAKSPAEAKPAKETMHLKDTGREEGKDTRVMSASGLKAGLAGSMGLLLLLLVSLIPFELLTCLVMPGVIVVCVSTGMLASVLAGDEIQTRRQAVRTGALAGFVAGIGGGMAGMVAAAFGALFPALGEGVLAQLSPSQLQSLAQIGILPDTIRLAGSILSALMACGVGGMAVSAALGALGGRIYFRLR